MARPDELEFQQTVIIYPEDVKPFEDQWNEAHNLGLVTASEEKIDVFSLLDRALAALQQDKSKMR